MSKVFKAGVMTIAPPYEPIPEPRVLPGRKPYCDREGAFRRDFAQSVDWSRPLRLLRVGDPKKMGQLYYVYLDTNETACVPNVPYNQLSCFRRGYADFCVKNQERRLADLARELKGLPLGEPAQDLRELTRVLEHDSHALVGRQEWAQGVLSDVLGNLRKRATERRTRDAIDVVWSVKDAVRNLPKLLEWAQSIPS